MKIITEDKTKYVVLSEQEIQELNQFRDEFFAKYWKLKEAFKAENNGRLRQLFGALLREMNLVGMSLEIFKPLPNTYQILFERDEMLVKLIFEGINPRESYRELKIDINF